MNKGKFRRSSAQGKDLFSLYHGYPARHLNVSSRRSEFLEIPTMLTAAPVCRIRSEHKLLLLADLDAFVVQVGF